MIDFVNVGKKIAKLRLANKMTQDDLADKLNITRQALSKWENGISIPSIDALLDLSQIFHTTIDEILCLDEKIKVNSDNIFEGHSREFIIRGIIKKDIDVNIPDVFYLFSPMERMQILKAIKNEDLIVDLEELYVKLTPGEQRYLYKGDN